MDLRQRTTVATDPFATIKGIGSLTLRAEQYADLDAPSVARSVSVERTLQTLVNLSAQAHPLETSTLKGAARRRRRRRAAPPDRSSILPAGSGVAGLVRDDVRASAGAALRRSDGK